MICQSRWYFFLTHPVHNSDGNFGDWINWSLLGPINIEFNFRIQICCLLIVVVLYRSYSIEFVWRKAVKVISKTVHFYSLLFTEHKMNLSLKYFILARNCANKLRNTHFYLSHIIRCYGFLLLASRHTLGRREYGQ